MQLPENYILIERKVKHARLRVSEDEKVRIIAPPEFSEDDILALLEKKKRWIAKQLSFFAKKESIQLQRNQLLLYGNRYNYFYDSEFKRKVQVNHEHKTIKAERDLTNVKIQEKWLKGIAKKYLTKRMNELSENLNLPFNQLYIRNQRTKWGNCSKEKNISINWRLIKAPDFVIDYLIIHELVHTIRMDHSVKFWTLLRSYFPEYKKAVKWLDLYGNSL